MSTTTTPQAFVVFSDETRLWWLKGLKPGFRHCFALLNDGQHWITFDPLSCFTEITIIPANTYQNLPLLYEEQGFTLVPASLNRAVRRILPLGLFTCVEAIKHLLGLWAPFVVTPWQLYRHLLSLSSSTSQQGV